MIQHILCIRCFKLSGSNSSNTTILLLLKMNFLEREKSSREVIHLRRFDISCRRRANVHQSFHLILVCCRKQFPRFGIGLHFSGVKKLQKWKNVVESTHHRLLSSPSEIHSFHSWTWPKKRRCGKKEDGGALQKPPFRLGTRRRGSLFVDRSGPQLIFPQRIDKSVMKILYFTSKSDVKWRRGRAKPLIAIIIIFQ